MTSTMLAVSFMDVGVSRELLDGGDVGAALEQVPDERPPQVVGGERDDIVLAGAAGQHVQDGLVGECVFAPKRTTIPLHAER